MTDTETISMLRIAHDAEGASYRSRDEHAVAREIAGVLVADDGREISDACARVIASWYAAGTGPGYAFVSTGYVPPLSDEHPLGADEVYRDLFPAGQRYLDAFGRLCADMLGTYLVSRTDRGPAPGWSDLWIR